MKVIIEIAENTQGHVGIMLSSDGLEQATEKERAYAWGIKELLNENMATISKKLGAVTLDLGNRKQNSKS